MASDKLNQIGRYIKESNRKSDLALKRVTNIIPKKERARDTVSSVFPFRMNIETENESQRTTVDINFNKPPPNDCSAGCISTACEDFAVSVGGHSLTLQNPYEPNTIKVFSSGVLLNPAQWYEENPAGGQVFVQVTNARDLLIICYSFIIC